jgi:hypothetical protein
LNSSGKHLLVIVLSFAVVAASGLATYGAWFLLPGAETLTRGVVSLFSWIVTFYIGAFLFWKTVVRISR